MSSGLHAIYYVTKVRVQFIINAVYITNSNVRQQKCIQNLKVNCRIIYLNLKYKESMMFVWNIQIVPYVM